MTVIVERNELASRIANNVVRLRKERGWTQQELAERAGCARITVNRLENAQRVADAEVLFAVADAFQIPTDELRQAERF